jgi:hypothetical protein
MLLLLCEVRERWGKLVIVVVEVETSPSPATEQHGVRDVVVKVVEGILFRSERTILQI